MADSIDVERFLAGLADDDRLARELDVLAADGRVLAELEPQPATLVGELVARALCVFFEAQLRGLHLVDDAAEYQAALFETFGEVDLPEQVSYEQAVEQIRARLADDRARVMGAPGPDDFESDEVVDQRLAQHYGEDCRRIERWLRGHDA